MRVVFTGMGGIGKTKLIESLQSFMNVDTAVDKHKLGYDKYIDKISALFIETSDRDKLHLLDRSFIDGYIYNTEVSLNEEELEFYGEKPQRLNYSVLNKEDILVYLIPTLKFLKQVQSHRSYHTPHNMLRQRMAYERMHMYEPYGDSYHVLKFDIDSYEDYIKVREDVVSLVNNIEEKKL